MFEHKGYKGSITTVDKDASLFHGRVVGIQDVVTFEGKGVADLVKAFRDSVDDYLAFCAERKETPEKPFSGRFVLRMPPELHRLVSEAASQDDVSLNTWIVAAAEMRLNQSPPTSSAMSFEELDRVAECVAAILAEKKRPSVLSKQRADASKRPHNPKSAREKPQRAMDS